MAEHCPCTFLAIFVSHKRQLTIMKKISLYIALLGGILLALLLSGCKPMHDPVEEKKTDGRPADLTVKDFDRLVVYYDLMQIKLREPRPTIIEVYRPDCSACQRLMPHMERFAEEYRGRVAISYLNTRLNESKELRQIIEKLRIQQVPTLLFIHSDGSYVTAQPMIEWTADEIDGRLRAEADLMIQSYK